MTTESQQLIRKNITIRNDQDEFVQKKHLNLSSFVREKLDEYMEKFPDEDEQEHHE